MLSRVEKYQNKKKKDRISLASKILSVYTLGVLGVTTFSGTAPSLKGIRTVKASGLKTKGQFLEEVSSYASEVAAENDLYASVMVAQALLESNWGGSGLASSPNHNLFGIKGNYKGQSVQMRTQEDNGKGGLISVVASFRKYPSYRESLEDYVDLITGNNNPNSWRYKYYAGARKSQTNNYKEATQHLTGRYATDVNYASKLNRIIESNQLYKLDGGSVTPSPGGVVENPNLPKDKSNKEVTVIKGDTLYKIARDNGLTLDDLYKLNPSIKGEIIYPGQKVKVVGGNINMSSQPENKPVEKPIEDTSIKETGMVIRNKEVIVVKGDNLYRIARNNGITLEDLYKLNPDKKGKTIYPGDKVKVTGKEGTVSKEVSKHFVIKGDTYWAIARKYKLNPVKLVELNGAKDLYPGDVVRLK